MFRADWRSSGSRVSSCSRNRTRARRALDEQPVGRPVREVRAHAGRQLVPERALVRLGLARPGPSPGSPRTGRARRSGPGAGRPASSWKPVPVPERLQGPRRLVREAGVVAALLARRRAASGTAAPCPARRRRRARSAARRPRPGPGGGTASSGAGRAGPARVLRHQGGARLPRRLGRAEAQAEGDQLAAAEGERRASPASKPPASRPGQPRRPPATSADDSARCRPTRRCTRRAPPARRESPRARAGTAARPGQSAAPRPARGRPHAHLDPERRLPRPAAAASASPRPESRRPRPSLRSPPKHRPPPRRASCQSMVSG